MRFFLFALLLSTSLFSQNKKEVTVIMKDGSKIYADLFDDTSKALKLFIVKPSHEGKKRKKYDRKKVDRNSVERIIVKATNSSVLGIRRGQIPRGYKWNKHDGYTKKPQDKYKDIHTLDGNFTYQYVYANKKKKKLVLMQLEVEGKCNLYMTVDTGGGRNYVFTKYVKRASEDFVTEYNVNVLFGKKFKKVSKNYFDDCPQLLELLKSKKIKTTVKTVQYYNENCGS